MKISAVWSSEGPNQIIYAKLRELIQEHGDILAQYVLFEHEKLKWKPYRSY